MNRNENSAEKKEITLAKVYELIISKKCLRKLKIKL